MRRPQKLIDRLHGIQRISTIHQNPRIAGERRRIARNIDNPRHFPRRQEQGLGGGTGARRVEHNRIVRGEFLDP